ncbi:siderophore-interacting protein [Acrocarpospora pleiomorpha]|uniref:Siderophore-interacting protein n=1 Tax=Acrocarpospora pleiomorpha TaxID=90975 RepID=A0A5M3XPU2_9ACTN|nr:siderophore-interacting protein [Acrocarpospora pleiomorpha]GES21671.1 siderophore-interacting protein [Acrocarpospora pleiomorpha]
MSVTIVEYPLKPRLLEVSRVQRITPTTVRVTLTGADLEGFQEAAPADHVKLCLPEPGAALPVMPTLGPDGLEPPPPGSPRPILRDYTVRDYRAAENELDVDMVLHGHGPAATWAGRATPGDRVGVLGPRGSVMVPLVLDWYLLGADETAIPALARWLKLLPATAKVIAFAEVADAREEQDLPSAADVSLTWLHRDGVAAGESDVLVRAFLGVTRPAGEGFAWVAGEAGTLVPIRRHLRGDFGLPKDRVDVDGYWKRGIVNLDHHEQDDED